MSEQMTTRAFGLGIGLVFLVMLGLNAISN
jgi:hypothetical protein